MDDQDTESNDGRTRRGTLAMVAGVGLAAGTIGTGRILADEGSRSARTGSSTTQENDQTVQWDGDRGSEHATQDCPDSEGYWHWVLMPGPKNQGSHIEEGAILTVRFDDDSETTVEGHRKGNGDGAVHFDVTKPGGGTATWAEAEFSGGGDEPHLTISDGECREGETPEPTPTEEEPTPTEEEPTPTEAEPTPTEAEPTPTEAEPTPTEAEPTPTEAEPTPTEAEPTPTEAEPTPTEAEPTPTEAEPTSTPEDTPETQTFEDLGVSLECVNGDGTLTVTNGNDEAVTVTVTGPDGYSETEEVPAGGSLEFAGLQNGTYNLASHHDDIGLEETTVDVDF